MNITKVSETNYSYSNVFLENELIDGIESFNVDVEITFFEKDYGTFEEDTFDVLELNYIFSNFISDKQSEKLKPLLKKIIKSELKAYLYGEY